MDGFRLSPQQSLLDHAALGPSGDRLWSQQILVQFDGEPVDESALRQALAAVLDAHEILHTVFTRLSGVRVQAIAGNTPDGFWTSVDLRELDAAGQADAIDRHRGEQETGIPGESELSLRATFFRLADDRAILLIATSPMLADGPTLVSIVSETLQRAAGEAVSGDADDEELEYADISEWLNDILEGEDGAAEREAWNRKLDAESDPPPLGSSNANDDLYRFERVTLNLDATDCERIQSLANDSDVSSQTVLTAAWLALLARLSATDSIVCGHVTDGRTYDELAGSLGPLAKSLPVEASLSETDGFRDYLERVHALLLDGDAHQEHFGVFSGQSDGAGFDYWVTLCDSIDATLRSVPAGPNATVIDIVAHDAPFRQKLSFLVSGDTISASLWFDPALSSRQEAEKLIERWGQFLDSALENPAVPLRQLSILLDGDRTAIDANERRDTLSGGQDQTLFAVLRSLDQWDPDAPAVSAGETTWSYSELIDCSNRISNALLDRDDVGEAPIAVCIGRRPELIAAILGVLNAGKTYIPIDPNYPAARIAQVVEDSGARILLTTDNTAIEAPTEQCIRLDVQRGSELLAEAGTSVPDVNVDEDSVAYILYTSGSTGTPKGVAVTRKNLAHSTAARLAYYGETPDAFLLLSSIAFDSSVAGLYWTLIGGGHLLLLETAQGLDVKEIASVCQRHRPSHTLCLPSVYRLLLDELSNDELESLRCVVVAGESCAAGVVAQHFKTAPDRKLVNEYGPTEGTVWCIAHTFSSEDDLSTGVPIGTAVPGYAIYLLDNHRQPVPVGYKGEIYIGGDGVAAGYWNQPDMTQERFIASDHDPSASLYRTGDIGRLRESGAIDFLGRRDNQVKINGYRIELEEVESAVKLLPGVVDAAVIVRSDDSDRPRLVAFVNTETQTTGDDLLQQLGERLPNYMLPSAVQLLSELPRTPNGKIDRAALAEVPLGEREDSVYVAPETELEHLIVDIWCELLERDRIGLEDDFFRSGGHSILATRLAARLREYLQIPVPIRVIFENPTISTLIEALRQDGQNAAQLDAVEKALASG